MTLCRFFFFFFTVVSKQADIDTILTDDEVTLTSACETIVQVSQLYLRQTERRKYNKSEVYLAVQQILLYVNSVLLYQST